MSSKTVIAVNNVSKRYEIYSKPRDRLLQFLSFGKRQYFKEFWAVRDVSFTIGRGETVGIIGQNGSGKSTLLQMICKTVTPTTGSIVTNGRIAALLELGAGFNPEFTGRENVLLNAEILGFSQAAMQERMADVLAFSELGDFLDQPVKTYSSGMYARLAFSVAVHVDPDILVIDETLAVGDSRFVAKCMRRIKDIQEQGVTILFVSHDVNSVRTLCQRAIWLNQGSLIADDVAFPVTSKYMEFMFRDYEPVVQSLESVDNCFTTQTTPMSCGLSVESMDPADKPQDVGSGIKCQDLVLSNSSAALQLDNSNENSKPITHWGSQKGMILNATIQDEFGNVQDVLHWGKQVTVVINLCIPIDIPREHLSIAFSIKDLKGTDLIVSSTYDEINIELPMIQCFSVQFCMVNYLITGKYLLVAAVENRMDKTINYYEYLEGAQYFASLANRQFFGIVQPAIEQLVRIQ